MSTENTIDAESPGMRVRSRPGSLSVCRESGCEPAIEVRGLHKAFNTRPRRPADGGTPAGEALRGINLTIEPGEFVALLGPNRAGKTTLLEILATLLLPTSGEARVFGRDVAREAAAVKSLIAYCPAADFFYPRLTGMQNLKFFATLEGLDARASQRQIRRLYGLLGLGDAGQIALQRESEGTRHKFSLARALLRPARLLLLDEPTRSLDPVSRRAVHRLLRDELRPQGITVFMVTHSLEEAEEVCGRALVLRDGRMALSLPAAAGRAELMDAMEFGAGPDA